MALTLEAQLNQQHLNLLRTMGENAKAADMDVAMGANVLLSLLDEIARLQEQVAAMSILLDAAAKGSKPDARKKA